MEKNGVVFGAAKPEIHGILRGTDWRPFFELCITVIAYLCYIFLENIDQLYLTKRNIKYSMTYEN
jgi:hypothetical protein